MARNMPRNPDFIDRKSLDRLRVALRTLAHVDGKPYLLNDSFLADDEAFDDEDPATQLGVYTERGSRKEGMMRFVWFDRQANDLLGKSGGEQERELFAQVDFAKEREDATKAQLAGTMRVYEFPEGTGEAIVGAHGYTLSNDLDVSFDFARFASGLGLAKLWLDVVDHETGPSESRLEGRMSKIEVSRFATAMGNLAMEASRP